MKKKQCINNRMHGLIAKKVGKLSETFNDNDSWRENETKQC